MPLSPFCLFLLLTIALGQLFCISSAIRCHKTVETENWEREDLEGECAPGEYCFKAFCEYSHSMPKWMQGPGFFIKGCAKEEACQAPKSRFWTKYCSDFKENWSDENWRAVNPCFLCNNSDLCNSATPRPRCHFMPGILPIPFFALMPFIFANFA